MMSSSIATDPLSVPLTILESTVPRESPLDLPSTLTDRTAFLLQLALKRAQEMGEQALGELGITGREYGILALLEHGSASAQHQLGSALGIDRTTTMAVLSALETRSLIRRARDPTNRRAYRVSLTEAGEQLRADAANVLADCDRRFLAPLAPEERARLRTTLLQLL